MATKDKSAWQILPYHWVVIPQEDGSFFAHIAEWPGCFAVGDDAGEAITSLIDDVADSWLAATLEQGQDVPPPADAVNAEPEARRARLPDQPPQATGEPVALETSVALRDQIRTAALRRRDADARSVGVIPDELLAILRDIDRLLAAAPASPAAPDTVGEIVKWFRSFERYHIHSHAVADEIEARWGLKAGESGRQVGDVSNGKIRDYRVALFMAAAHCQGGHSDAGAIIADLLGVPLPLRMESLADRARKEGLDPDGLWPWWAKMRAERGEYRKAGEKEKPDA
jgi:predicted RNase H-like HicB family nuclease